MSAPLRNFAEFLRIRRAEILADWQSAARPNDPNSSARGAARTQLVTRWLEEVTAQAEGREAAFSVVMRQWHDGQPAAEAIVRDVSTLHRVIAHRAHTEHVPCGVEESELLWRACETGLADLVTNASTVRRPASTHAEDARLYEDAQRAIRAREEILAMVTHDLRTPLSAVVAAASLLTSMDSVDPDGDRIRQRAETIQRAVQHMSRLITDLGDLAQIDSGRLGIDRVAASPADVVREAVDALEPLVARRAGTLVAQASATLPRIPLDPDRVRQVLANLVGNASKAGASRIVVGADVQGADLVFRVADNGPGIPPEDLPRMFERYWRGRETQYKGTGLGLPISNGIVKAHGGRMWIESTVGAGSTFYFSIPR